MSYVAGVFDCLFQGCEVTVDVGNTNGGKDFIGRVLEVVPAALEQGCFQ